MGPSQLLETARTKTAGVLVTATETLLARSPAWLEQYLAEQLLNRLLAEDIDDGEFDFMIGRRIGIQFEQPRYALLIDFDGKRFSVRKAPSGLQSLPRDAEIRGRCVALLRILARTADPDTLFFQRQITIDGDTELALAVKNKLDSVDADRLPAPLRFLLLRSARFAMGEEGNGVSLSGR